MDKGAIERAVSAFPNAGVEVFNKPVKSVKKDKKVPNIGGVAFGAIQDAYQELYGEPISAETLRQFKRDMRNNETVGPDSPEQKIMRSINKVVGL